MDRSKNGKEKKQKKKKFLLTSYWRSRGSNPGPYASGYRHKPAKHTRYHCATPPYKVKLNVKFELRVLVAHGICIRLVRLLILLSYHHVHVSPQIQNCPSSVPSNTKHLPSYPICRPMASPTHPRAHGQYAIPVRC